MGHLFHDIQTPAPTLSLRLSLSLFIPSRLYSVWLSSFFSMPALCHTSMLMCIYIISGRYSGPEGIRPIRNIEEMFRWIWINCPTTEETINLIITQPTSLINKPLTNLINKVSKVEFWSLVTGVWCQICGTPIVFTTFKDFYTSHAHFNIILL